jgi:agmatinase
VIVSEPIGPVDASKVPRFAGIATFARLPRLEDVKKADVAIVGIPFDTGVSYRSGARFGPAHVREASRLLRPYNPAVDVSPFGAQQVADAGDIACNPYIIEEAVQSIEDGVSDILDTGAKLMTIGGDHTIALPILRQLAKRHGPVSLVHFDAHLDTNKSYFGVTMTHGTPFRLASEEGVLDMTSSIHVGIRSPLYAPSDLTNDRELGFQVITTDDVAAKGVGWVCDQIRDLVGDKPVYVSVDIDVLDPAHAPGTGTPEAGGLTSRELLEMIRLFGELNLISADVVEVSPPYDHAQITAVSAAHVAYELISAMAPTKS